MAGNLPDLEISELKDAFSILDPKGVGFLGTSEIRKILTSLGKCGTDEEVARILKQVDTAENGKISFPEFLNMMAAKGSSSDIESGGELAHMFKIFDRDNSGFITYTELKQTLVFSQAVGTMYSKYQVSIFDRNRDGFNTHTGMKPRASEEMQGEQVPSHELDTMMNDADVDGDRKLSRSEFEAIMRTTYPGEFPE